MGAFKSTRRLVVRNEIRIHACATSLDCEDRDNTVPIAYNLARYAWFVDHVVYLRHLIPEIFFDVLIT